MANSIVRRWGIMRACSYVVWAVVVGVCLGHAQAESDELEAEHEMEVEAVRPVVRRGNARWAGDDGSGRSAMRRHRPGRLARAGMVQDMLEQMEEADPDRFDELRQLRDSDPVAFRDELKTLVKAHRRATNSQGQDSNEHGKLERETLKLARQYRRAQTEDERERILETLKTTIAAAFDERQTSQEARLERVRERLKKSELKLEQRRRQKEMICKQRLDELLRDPALRW